MNYFRQSVKVLAIVLFSLCFIQCGEDKDYIGHWERNIEDGEYSGNEFIVLNEDSTIQMGNNLQFKGIEDGFSYNMKFQTSIDGKWEKVGKDIVVHINLESFKFKSVPNTFNIYMMDRDSMEYKGEYRDEMKNLLINELKSRFTNFYSMYANRPYVLQGIEVTNNIMHCTTDIAELNFNRK